MWFDNFSMKHSKNHLDFCSPVQNWDFFDLQTYFMSKWWIDVWLSRTHHWEKLTRREANIERWFNLWEFNLNRFIVVMHAEITRRMALTSAVKSQENNNKSEGSLSVWSDTQEGFIPFCSIYQWKTHVTLFFASNFLLASHAFIKQSKSNANLDNVEIYTRFEMETFKMLESQHWFMHISSMFYTSYRIDTVLYNWPRMSLVRVHSHTFTQCVSVCVPTKR